LIASVGSHEQARMQPHERATRVAGELGLQKAYPLACASALLALAAADELVWCGAHPPHGVYSLSLVPAAWSHNFPETRSRAGDGRPETLTRIDASANELSAVPEALALSLPLLRSMDVSKNGLRALPANLCECAELQTLRVSHNGLRGLEFIPFPLQRLVELRADKNSLSELPPCLWLCPRLKHVSLCANRLGLASLAMPTGAAGAGDGGAGGGGAAADPVAPLVAPLELLDLGENRLGALPPLGLYPNLREVHVQQNGIRELPVAQITPLLQLQTLDISMNDVSLLPPALARLPSLQHLSIAGNPIRSIPRSVQEGGSSAVIDLLRKRLPVEVCELL